MMPSVPLHPYVEARLRVEAEKRRLTPEALATEIISILLEDACTDEQTKLSMDYLLAVHQSVNPKSAVDRLHRDRREDLAREEMRFERQVHEGKPHGNS